MASIFKQQYTTKGKDGEKIKKKSKFWYIDYKSVDGIRKRVKGFRDKTATMQLAAKLEKEAELAEVGIIDRFKEHRKTPLSKHLEDFENSILADGLTEHHAKTTRKRAEQIIKACGFCFWNDISASKTQAYISGLQKTKAAKTCKHFQQAAKQFCSWMVKDQRASENPLAYLKPVTVTKANTEQRRAMEPAEIQWLLACTEPSGMHRGMTGNERSLLYRLALETGLRSNELRSLKVSAIDLGRMTVSVKAENTKNHKEAILPLRKETAKLLKVFLANKLPKTQVFNMPHKSSVVKMFRRDLAGARKQWIEEVKHNPAVYEQRNKSDFLKDKTESGKLVFHGLRHTFGSLLAAGNVHPKTAQELMRHSDINLTMSRYTHVFRGQESQAVAKLPDFSAPTANKQKMTGTDNNPIDCAYKPAYKKLTKTADSGCDQSAVIGNTTEAIREDTIREMKDGKALIDGMLGNKKAPLSLSDNEANSDWAGLDSNQRRLTPMGLQPIPFSHSGTDPCNTNPNKRILIMRGLIFLLTITHKIFHAIFYHPIKGVKQEFASLTIHLRISSTKCPFPII